MWEGLLRETKGGRMERNTDDKRRSSVQLEKKRTGSNTEWVKSS